MTPGTVRDRGRGWWFLAAAIGSEVTASLSLKGALDRPLLYVVVAAGFVSAFTLLALVIRAGIPVGVAYGIWGASGVALTAVLSHVVHGEPLTPLMGAGIVLVILGVLAIELGSQRSAPRSGTIP